jgi:hypothetical protein
MSVQVHYNNAEIDRVIIGVFAFLVFVMVALRWFPEFVAPGGGSGPAEVGNLIRMIQ